MTANHSVETAQAVEPDQGTNHEVRELLASEPVMTRHVSVDHRTHFSAGNLRLKVNAMRVQDWRRGRTQLVGRVDGRRGRRLRLLSHHAERAYHRLEW